MKSLSNSAVIPALLLGCILAFGLGAATEAAAEVTRREVGIDEQLGVTIPLDLEFYDEAGQLTRLRDLVKKPTILTLVFYECKGICTPLLVELSGIVNKLGLEPGSDYQILTISFDPREKPELAQAKRFNFLKLLDKEPPAGFWKFMTGEAGNIRQLTDSVGFYYKQVEDQYVHAGALMFLSPEGKVTRYLLGTEFLPFNVKMALIEASEGKVGPTIAKLLKFCYAYDPEGRTYAMNLTRVIGAGMLVLVGAFVFFVILKPKRAAK